MALLLLTFFIVTSIVGVYNCSMLCCTLLYVHSSIAIILTGKREPVALLNLSSWCLVMVEWLFLAVPWGCLWYVIVVFPDHSNLQFFSIVEVCTVAILDDSSESPYTVIESLVESLSVSYCGDVNDINISLGLTVVQQSQVREIISDYSNTFTTRPGCTTLIEHGIKLTTDTPVRVKQYSLPFSTMETIKGEIKEMIVEPSDSPYCSPVLIVKKRATVIGFA